jgi:hypothetical protein
MADGEIRSPFYFSATVCSAASRAGSFQPGRKKLQIIVEFFFRWSMVVIVKAD